MSTFESNGAGLWTSLHPACAGQSYRQCRNYAEQGVCNWMISASSTDQLCASCELTLTIPTLSSLKNRLYWTRIEAAKRRLLYTLWQLHLRPTSKTVDQKRGIAFEFLEDIPKKPVTTGHANGLITLNVVEADAAHREMIREQLGEPYRTLLGHFRHESGHYYWERLIANTQWHEPFRALFGDERKEYGQALRSHYLTRGPDRWDHCFISRYASAHPWEDWAETWAHFLHMIDTLDTAYWCGMTVQPRKAYEPVLAIAQGPLELTSFDELMSNWFALTSVLNSLNRSIGMPDPYPFSLSDPARRKIQFVYQVVQERRAASAPTGIPDQEMCDGSSDSAATPASACSDQTANFTFSMLP